MTTIAIPVDSTLADAIAAVIAYAEQAEASRQASAASAASTLKVNLGAFANDTAAIAFATANDVEIVTGVGYWNTTLSRFVVAASGAGSGFVSITKPAEDAAAEIVAVFSTLASQVYAVLPIMRHEALLALKAHSTSGVNWLDALLAGLSPQMSDDSNLKTMEASFWPVGGQAWAIAKTILAAALAGGFSDAQLVALQAEAIALRETV